MQGLMFTRLSDFIQRRAKFVVGFAVAYLLVGAVVGGSVFKVLKPFGFDDPSTDSIIARERLADAAKTEAEPGVVALIKLKGPVQSAEGSDLVTKSQQAIAANPHIAKTASILEGGQPGMVSKDGHATYVLGYFRNNVADDVKQDTAEDIGHRLDKLGPQVTAGGIATAYLQINKQVEHDLQVAEMIVFPLLFLLSLWVFRGLIAAALPPLVGGLAIVGSLLGLRVLAEFLDLSIFAVNLITATGLGLAIDYSLFMVSRFREELARKRTTPRQALRATMNTAGRTVFFSGLTVAGAMASLLIFPQRFLYSMGVGGTLVAILAATVSLTILPAILWLLGKRVNAMSPAFLQRRAEAAATEMHSGFWYRLSRIVMRRPLPIAMGAATVMVVIGLPFLGVKFNFADAKVLPHSASARQVSQVLDTEFPPNQTDPIQIAVEPGAKPDALAAYTARIDGLSHVDQVTPPQPVGRGVSEITVFYSGDHFSDTTKRLVKRIRNIDTPFTAYVGGSPARALDQDTSLSGHIGPMVAIVAFATLLVLFMMTGSVILPIKAFIMNVLTVSAAFGALVLIFQHGRLEGLLSYESTGGIDESNALLIFAVAFGLSTDYGVFLLTRIKESRDAGASDSESVAIGMERTGRLITAAALLLCVAVLAFATSKIIFIKQFSIGVAVAVGLDATIVRALLVPSLMQLLGKWNWWAPKPLRRLHERYGIAEHA
jgi:RND superfamily putative drug exporter